ncbi:hypothetical protein FLL96_01150 [Vibrio cholerae]|nr:hypothetical protein [Vibrio cholerae]TQP18461.1 hypothetical protein FLL96_01150 [Vibrio cholerae]TQQ53212.1 hypothetical protein FLL62_10755 [Vibrio cholerae]
MDKHDELVRDLLSKITTIMKKQNFTLSSDDSGLKNIWEEFCAQVQGEESIFWDEYRKHAIEMIELEFQALPEEERQILLGDDLELCDDDVIYSLFEKLQAKAEDYESDSLARFLRNEDERISKAPPITSNTFISEDAILRELGFLALTLGHISVYHWSKFVSRSAYRMGMDKGLIRIKLAHSYLSLAEDQTIDKEVRNQMTESALIEYIDMDKLISSFTNNLARWDQHRL